MADRITFLLNGERIELAADTDPATTLLDWLREDPRRRGTKEGCAEGDCGACTVVLERLREDGAIDRAAVTSCILLLSQVDGLGVRTVEGIGAPGTPGDYLQQAMAEGGGTQCGFCTPGFMMSGEALIHANDAPSVGDIHDAIAGNLCRCTGYKPIVEAFQKSAERYHRARSESAVGTTEDPLRGALAALAAETAGDRVFEGNGRRFQSPASLAHLITLRAHDPSADLIAGATDLGLLAGRDRNPPSELISVSRVPELDALDCTASEIIIGAAVTYRRALPVLLASWPELTDYLARLGSAQIRGSGTIGGNLATASPIGDMAPVLIALGADVSLASSRGARRLPVEDFLTGYRRNALMADEVIRAIVIPARKPAEDIVAEKLSRRRDQDISTLTAAIRVTRSEGIVQDCRLAFGGMADRVTRARGVEQALAGTSLEPGQLQPALDALAVSFSPIDDVRAPADYRRKAAANLLQRMVLRLSRRDLVLELDRL